MKDYEFVTIWRVKAPLESVWNEIYHSDLWPDWWKGVESVELVRKGDESGVGSVHRYTWKSKLPYRLSFEMQAVRVEPPVLLEGIAAGELAGRGVWRLSSENDETIARYDWKVETTKRWMNLLAPIARPVFKWNHDVVMGWGAQGLAKRLGVSVIEVKEEGR
jgi:Polyketide cyclase / dehydrase and lipid transport.